MDRKKGKMRVVTTKCWVEPWDLEEWVEIQDSRGCNGVNEMNRQVNWREFLCWTKVPEHR